MKKLFIAAAVLAGVSGAALAHETGSGAQAHSHPVDRAHSHSGPTVTKQIRIDCYRGPWKETIWDHPRAAFIDDLVAFGYDSSDASAIAYRVCRDVTALGDSDALRTNLLNAIAQTPPTHKPSYSH